MKIETVEFILPAHWASALINEDYSGLDYYEKTEIKSWLADNAGVHCVGCTDDTEFTAWHDAREYCLACDCLVYTFHAFNA